MLIAGVILMTIGGILFFLAVKMNNKILKLRVTEVKPIKELLETYQAVAEDLGEMTHKALATVGIYGRVKSDEPLQSPLSDTSCVYYDYQEEYQVEYEEVTEETNDQGESVTNRRTVREWRSGDSDKKYIPFYVDDETERIEVDAEGLTFDLKHNKKVEVTPISGTQGLLDSFVSALTNRERVVALRKTEITIPLDFKVFVTGAITPTNKNMIIAKHQEKKELFTLADRSLDTLIKDVKNRQLLLYVFAGLCDLSGVALAIFSIIR